jgi:YebC/PmpR family DNA-binding regulatory protein
MSGHSKWSTIKRAKGAADAKRGQAFSKIAKEIMLAARSGGGDANMNPRLRTILLKARDANMPSDNIDRAIKKGTGELEGQIIEENVYEGYGPGGIGMIVKVATDNKNRAASDVRSTFSKNGGNLASTGAVSFQFLHCGQFLISKEKSDEETLMELALDAGADDVRTSEQGFEILCPISEFDTVSAALEAREIKPDSAKISYVPTTPVPVTEVSVAKTFYKLQSALEDLDEVQSVFSNEDISDEISEAAQA